MTHARLADSNTPRELVRSQNVQLGAILGRFGDVAEAVEYCRGICSETTNSRLALEYGGYLRALVGIGVSV
jgi:hypothetical protein